MLHDADASFAERLAASLPDLSLLKAEPSYLEEPRGLYRSSAAFVARPGTTEEVAAVVKACAEARVGIVPYGGGTGLVSGQISSDGVVPLIVSLEKMPAIRATFPAEDVLIAEAGATLAEIQRAASDMGRLFPLSYASQDSARIGGALAVNSGGINVLRYGMARELCLGIEAVLPDGQIFHGLTRLKKDNTGYDLRHLLIGSEGTLGIITAAALALAPRPAHVATAFLAVPSPAAALDLFALFRDRAADTISAFELISREGFEFLDEAGMDHRRPFETIPDWSVLVEIGTSPEVDPDPLLMDIFETAMTRGLILDGAIAQSGQQRGEFWAVRESLPAANRRIGAIASHDISLPLTELPGFIRDARAAVAAIAPVRITCFGHLGDGNLHYNAFPPRGENRRTYADYATRISEAVHDMVMARGGSFSAEHGVGRIKVGALQRYGDPAKLSAMRAIKSALDPLGIMNPGAVLPRA